MVVLLLLVIICLLTGAWWILGLALVLWLVMVALDN